MKKILILILLVIFASCSDGNKKEDPVDNDGNQDLVDTVDEEVTDETDTSDEFDQSDQSDEESDESEVSDQSDEVDIDEAADESSDEVADETSDDDFIPECSEADDCGTHENECKGYDCTEGKCIEKDLDEKTCDDLNACTDNDKCTAGVCKGADKDCTSMDTPCGEGKCNTANGECYYDEFGDGTLCDDGNDCTAGDKCESGACEGIDYTCFNSGTCLEDDYLCSCTAGFDPDLYCYECLGNYSASSSCADCADGFGGDTCNCSITGYGGDVKDFWIEDGTMNIFSVGHNGTIMRYTSTGEWVVQKSNTTRDLNTIFGFSETNIYAGGNNVLLHWDGTNWKRLNDVFSSTDYTITSLWGSGPTDLWAADNYNQKVYHYDGISWSEKTSDKFLSLIIEVWGTASDNVYVVSYNSSGGTGRVTHWDGTEWTTVLDTDVQVYEITGTDADNIYVAGIGKVWNYNGTAWNEMTGVPSVNFTDADASGSYLYLVSYGGKLVTYNGSTWTETDTGLENVAAVAKGKFRVYMGGKRNGIFSSVTLPNILFSVMPLSTASINDIAVSDDGTIAYAVGSGGKVYRYADGIWAEEFSGATSDLYSVSIYGSTVYAAGDAGTLIRRMNDEWSSQAIDSDYTAMNFRGVYVWSQNGGGMRFLLAGYDPNNSDKGFVTVSTFLNNMLEVQASYDPGKVTKIHAFKDSETLTVVIGSNEGKVSYYHSTDTTTTNDSITEIDDSAGAVTSVYVFNKFKTYVGKTDSKILECGDAICSEMTVNSTVNRSIKGVYKETAVDQEGRIYVLDSNEWSEQISKIGNVVTITAAAGSDSGIFMAKSNEFINFYSCD